MRAPVRLSRVKRTILSASGLALLIHLAGCERQSGTEAPPQPGAAPTVTASNASLASPPPEAPPLATPTLATPTPAASEEFPPLPPFPATERDPAKVVLWWRQALEQHEYASARRVWGDSGKASGQSEAQFAAAWDKYRIIDITAGKGEVDGAAGSLFYEIPVTVTGLRRDGKPYNLSGTVTLRRVNDVDGATPEQLRWHIERSTLQP